MDQDLKDAANALFTIASLLEEHTCQEDEVAGFPLPICKLCAASEKATEIVDRLTEKYNSDDKE